MDISNYNKAEVLAALYNGSRVQGLGFLHATGKPMTTEEAQAELDASPDKYFDYLHGKVMKIDLSTNDLQTRLYNRDNGPDAAESIIADLKVVA